MGLLITFVYVIIAVLALPRVYRWFINDIGGSLRADDGDRAMAFMLSVLVSMLWPLLLLVPIFKHGVLPFLKNLEDKEQK